MGGSHLKFEVVLQLGKYGMFLNCLRYLGSLAHVNYTGKPMIMTCKKACHTAFNMVIWFH